MLVQHQVLCDPRQTQLEALTFIPKADQRSS